MPKPNTDEQVISDDESATQIGVDGRRSKQKETKTPMTAIQCKETQIPETNTKQDKLTELNQCVGEPTVDRIHQLIDK